MRKGAKILVQSAGIYDSDVIQGAIPCGSLETDGAMIYDQTFFFNLFFRFHFKLKKMFDHKSSLHLSPNFRTGLHLE